MSALELINLGCAIVSASAGVAPLVKKWKPKDGRRKTMKKSHRQPRILAQEESHRDATRLRPRSRIEAEIRSRHIEDLIQAQVAATLQSILKDGLINSIGLDDAPIKSEYEPVPHLVNHIRHKSLESSIPASSCLVPNGHRQEALEGPPLQALPFSVLESSQDIAIQTYPMRSFSFPASGRFRRGSLQSPPLPALSCSIPNPHQPMSPGMPLPRASSFPLPSQYPQKSLKFRPRTSSIPMPNQWRRSLKVPPSALSSPLMSQANAIDFPHSHSGSFHDILGLDLLSQILPYLDNFPIQDLIHHAAEWSYSQTLAQLLHPDHFYPKEGPVMRQSYLSSSVRLHIWFCACTVSEEVVLILPIATFLIRFIMQYGSNILLDVPHQLDDPTGLRELESRYEITYEILRFLDGK